MDAERNVHAARPGRLRRGYQPVGRRRAFRMAGEAETEASGGNPAQRAEVKATVYARSRPNVPSAAQSDVYGALRPRRLCDPIRMRSPPSSQKHPDLFIQEL